VFYGDLDPVRTIHELKLNHNPQEEEKKFFCRVKEKEFFFCYKIWLKSWKSSVNYKP